MVAGFQTLSFYISTCIHCEPALDDAETLIGAVSGLMTDCNLNYKPLDSHAL